MGGGLELLFCTIAHLVYHPGTVHDGNIVGVRQADYNYDGDLDLYQVRVGGCIRVGHSRRLQ